MLKIIFQGALFFVGIMLAIFVLSYINIYFQLKKRERKNRYL